MSFVNWALLLVIDSFILFTFYPRVTGNSAPFPSRVRAPSILLSFRIHWLTIPLPISIPIHTVSHVTVYASAAYSIYYSSVICSLDSNFFVSPYLLLYSDPVISITFFVTSRPFQHALFYSLGNFNCHLSRYSMSRTPNRALDSITSSSALPSSLPYKETGREGKGKEETGRCTRPLFGGVHSLYAYTDCRPLGA